MPAKVDDEEEPELSLGNQSLVPSSMGFTFCVDGKLESLEVVASWGSYHRAESDSPDPKTGNSRRCWKRRAAGGTLSIALKKQIPPMAPDAECPAVLVQGSVSAPLANGDRLVTLFLLNTQPQSKENQDESWVFQPELRVRDPQKRAVFRRRPLLRADEFDEEREALEMIYRDRVEFAVGHGISVHATPAEDNPELATEVRTEVMPDYEVQVTETPGQAPEDRPMMKRLIDEGLLDMEELAKLPQEKLVSGLRLLTQDYAAWITENRARIKGELPGYGKPAEEALGRCELILARLEEGIRVLETNEHALTAFRFANQAMATQRVRSLYALRCRRGEKLEPEAMNERKNRSWRAFQLAFMLLSIPALADPAHKDRTEPMDAFADLLWFPTGGGKTEAYLGVAAFTMGIRRLQGTVSGLDGSRGLAVIMRYTLRLLTLQQFQRATVLICAMEVIRKANVKIWGEHPFSLGLWVGQKVTPNTTDESHEAIEKERNGQYGTGSTPAQLTTCPWCGSEIAPGREIAVDRDKGRTYIYCGDKYSRCPFSRNQDGEGLPVVLVDEELYHRPPTMLIATVDKFAMMAWRGEVRTLFGKARQECPRHGLLWPEADCKGQHPKKGVHPATEVKAIAGLRPPDLIIQDEFHLISGPLGTMVGLYESAVDELCTWDHQGQRVRPKVIASTATVRKAEEQVNNVFMRQVSVFPPHGLDVGDNFFSVQRPIEDKPGRRYLAICAPGSSRPAVQIRLYVALLTAAQDLFFRFGPIADPYMTVVGYFNSLRELGGMRRLAEDDVQTRSYRVNMSEVKRPGLRQRSIKIIDELTSRVSSKEIPKKLDQLEIKFKDERDLVKGEARAIDVVLATNMLSVGVDVNRIGLMAVNGQPKNTAEYIQATSRVGRAFPGIVFTVLTWSRPRDLSHYETFEHYHATFYKHVEAQSVTPFAPRALDRGLTGAMVSLLRLQNESLVPNLGAGKLDSTAKPELATTRGVLGDRAQKVMSKPHFKANVEKMISVRADQWAKEAMKPGRKLGYESGRGQGDTTVALLKKPGLEAWDSFTVPMSMREVEPGVRLIMENHTSEPPEWTPQIREKSKRRKEDAE